MKFEKARHHYVPQFWQRGFRSPTGQLFRMSRNHIRSGSTRDTFASPFLYTIFDETWTPSDACEDHLSRIEGVGADLFRRLSSLDEVAPSDRARLCFQLGLQASRHPDVLGRAHRLAGQFAKLLTEAHETPCTEFSARCHGFGVAEDTAEAHHALLRSFSREELLSQYEQLVALSPQSPELPEQMALLAAWPIARIIEGMELWLLDAPPTEEFVLGDTPLPQADLARGFSVPLTQALAVLALEADGAQQNIVNRRVATVEEVQAINRNQADNCREVVIGPNPDCLRKL